MKHMFLVCACTYTLSHPNLTICARRKENDKLRQEIKELQADRDGSASLQKLALQFRESEARCEELSAQLQAEKEFSRSLQEKQGPLKKMAEQSREQAESSTKTALELERKVKNLTAQLKAASGDLDEAAQHEVSRQSETEKLKQEIEMQQMDILSLQKQLGDAIAEDSALRMEKDEEIENMQHRMVSKHEVELAKQDTVALQNKNAELRRQISDQDDTLRFKLKTATDLEMQLSEASNMWHAAARDAQDLRKKVAELEAREPQHAGVEESLKRQIDDSQGEVGKKVDELLNSNKRIAVLTIEMHGLSGRLAQSRSEHTDCLKRISELTHDTVSADVHTRVQETSERAIKAEAAEKLRLKGENERLREELGRRCASSINHLAGLRDHMAGLENTMQVIEQAGFSLKTDTLHELGRLQHSNRDLQRSMQQTTRDLQHEKRHSGLADSDVQVQMRLLKSKAENEAQMREREQKKSRLLDDVMSEISLRLLEAEDTAVTSEQYLRDVSRVLRVAPNLLSSPTKFRMLPAMSAKEKGRSPLRKLFLDLESAAEDMDGNNSNRKYSLATPEGQRLEVYQKRVKELEAQLSDLRANSMPLRDYKELTQELASECDNVRKFTQEHVTARFQHQQSLINQLRKERDSASDRANVLDTQVQRQKTGLDKTSKSSAALQSRAKMLESELEAARRTSDMLALQKDEASQIASDLQVRNKYLQQERDQTEADLRNSERDITKLKSVIKVATDAVRKAAEQRQSDAAHRMQSVDGSEMPELAPLRLQILEMSRERDDLVEKMRSCAQREAYAVQLLEDARTGEVDALQQLGAVRQELEDLRAVANSLSNKLNLEAADEYERKLRESAARARSVHFYMCASLHVHLAIPACLPLRLHRYVCLLAHTHIFICTGTAVHVRLHFCIRVSMYIINHTHTHTHTCTRAHMHTHMHTNANASTRTCTHAHTRARAHTRLQVTRFVSHFLKYSQF